MPTVDCHVHKRIAVVTYNAELPDYKVVEMRQLGLVVS